MFRGAVVRVQRVVMPVSEVESWTVLGDDGDPVPAVEGFLGYLTAIERSPNTVRAYALSLKLWLEFLAAISKTFDARRRGRRGWFCGVAAGSGTRGGSYGGRDGASSAGDGQPALGRGVRFLRVSGSKWR